MSMKREELHYYFHVGLPKALSTFLQKRIFPRLDILYLGKHYDSSIDSRHNNKVFGDQFRKIFGAQPYNLDEEYIGRLHGYIQAAAAESGRKKVLYSNEGLVGSFAESFRNGMQIAFSLKKIFKNPKIILVIRRQDDFLESLYRQSIRMGYSVSVKKFLNLKKKSFGDYRIGYPLNIDLNTLNWNNLVAFYQDLYGADNVLVLPYELIRENGELFVEKLTGFMGVGHKTTLDLSGVNLPKTNVSDTYFLLIIMRFFNRLFHKKMQNLFVRLFYLKKLGNLINRLGLERLFIGRRLREKIIGFCRESNKELSEKKGLQLDKYGYF